MTGARWAIPPRLRADGRELELPADLVLIAIGFTGPEREVADGARRRPGPPRQSSRADFATSVDGVFAAGDARVGPSLIVTAIAEGRGCARAVARYLRSN